MTRPVCVQHRLPSAEEHPRLLRSRLTQPPAAMVSLWTQASKPFRQKSTSNRKIFHRPQLHITLTSSHSTMCMEASMVIKQPGPVRWVRSISLTLTSTRTSLHLPWPQQGSLNSGSHWLHQTFSLEELCDLVEYFWITSLVTFSRIMSRSQLINHLLIMINIEFKSITSFHHIVIA